MTIMMLTAALAVAGTGLKQQFDHAPIRFAIHHADPWAIKAMLEGASLTSPEMSVLWAFGGGAGGTNAGAGAAGVPFLADGYLVVNPTDNSIWWYPKSYR